MNSATLSGKILQEPEIRHTIDQKTLLQMYIAIPARKEDEELSLLKVSSWNQTCIEKAPTLKNGAQVLITGRLGIRTIDRPECFKEKRVELVAETIITL
jgi:single-stranded DNA-binding protein